MGIGYYLQVAVRWQSKNFWGKVAYRAGTKIGLLGYPVRTYDQSVNLTLFTFIVQQLKVQLC